MPSLSFESASNLKTNSIKGFLPNMYRSSCLTVLLMNLKMLCLGCRSVSVSYPLSLQVHQMKVKFGRQRSYYTDALKFFFAASFSFSFAFNFLRRLSTCLNQNQSFNIFSPEFTVYSFRLIIFHQNLFSLLQF